MAFTSTSQTDWTRSDIYHNSFLIPPNNALTAALKLSEKHGLPPYAVSEAQDGELLTCEISKDFAMIAQINIDNAGLTDKVKIIVGPAITTLSNIKSNASFDLAFIDADKQSNVEYFIQAKRLVRKGGVIIVDNVVRNGRVADPDQSDSNIDGVRKLLEYIGDDPTIEATTLGTVGEKGYDGFLYAINKPNIS
ncbi:unnamed protein product [Rotaria socialis]|uniref:O-methyltransferase n=1 Tax=Rotaria socialis TaxID=392032 RepID=A0A818BD60_9BILA|nr:unnamed protein product [Rotaria socialis]